MKYCFFLLVVLFLSISALSQMAALPFTAPSKPVIDSTAITNWADLLWSEPSITPDGKYFMYPIDNLPPGSKTLIIQSTQNGWKKEFIGADKGFFSGKSKLAVFRKKDSLYIQSLGKNQVLCIGNVASYKVPKAGAGQWIAYLTKGRELIVRDLFTDKEQRYQNVSEYQFDNNGRVLLLKEKLKSDSATSEIVEWISLSNNKRYTVWQIENDKQRSASRFSFDDAAGQLVFTVQDKTAIDPANTIWYYKEGEIAIEKINNQTPGIDSGMIITSGTATFSKNGNYIFFRIQPKPEPPLKPDPNAVQVDVWSYKDKVLQNVQLFNVLNKTPHFELAIEKHGILSLPSNSIITIGRRDCTNSFLKESGNYIVFVHRKYLGDKTWLDNEAMYSILSLNDGTINELKTKKCDFISFSPDGKMLIYYDYAEKNYFSYNLTLKKSTNLSDLIPTRLINENIDELTNDNRMPVGLAGWLSDNHLLIYDNYDIYKIDPESKNTPINLTHSFGKLHNIKLRIIKKDNNSDAETYEIEPLFLTGFNVHNKQNGFFVLNPLKSDSINLLSFGPYNYYTTASQAEIGLLNMKPIKAKYKNIWLVKRQAADEAPNFFATTDFKTFRQLTDLHPEKKVNWLITELVSWNQPDGKSCQGILYKPENFDSTKRYPVIVNYYDKKSANLNQFYQPSFIETEINIPWFVSRGYLIFTPDIRYTIGKTGQSVMNSIMSGIKYICRYPFIDSNRIGLQGHSFGGYETNFLITHSNVFAAACEGAGPTNWISNYGGGILPSIPTTISMHFEAAGQNRIEGTLWEKQDLYIENSPIFNAMNVKTPLLIMHNKKDPTVPWGQAVEFFIALRRLNKKVWMLQYDNEAHGVNNKKDAIDYTIRMTQFFDHYLKGKPAPKWMTQSVPARLKGVETDLQLDKENVIP